ARLWGLSSAQAAEGTSAANQGGARGRGRRVCCRYQSRGDPADYALAEAKSLIESYEWRGQARPRPPGPRQLFRWSLRRRGRLRRPVCRKPRSLGSVWLKIIALLRGACARWAHPHAASKLVRCSMRLLPEKYKVVTATVDGDAGRGWHHLEVGTI